ncbi:hypothetical protein [Paenibacillus sonchi]|uniref:hypothetical protein n=1 Tax=Paenibacillus sonchi TaxID=373687 RepID=UPI001E3AB55B|nr:hypothetical protein [Paenibacillus sonchi]MCE3202452.1 hypothetical protein [Paenibacillus sonchi]
MKKMARFLLLCVLMFSFTFPAYAEKVESSDEQLTSIQDVVDKVNAEIGSNFYIPAGNEEKVLNSFKDVSLEDVAILLKNEYKAASLDQQKETTIEQPDMIRSSINGEPRSSVYNKSSSVVVPFYVREDITQTYPIAYTSQMYLDSTVFSVTGGSGTYTYENILDYGSTWSSSNTGFHFQATSGSYSLSNSNKNCTLTLKGHPEDPNGIALGVILTATHTFSAG